MPVRTWRDDIAGFFVRLVLFLVGAFLMLDGFIFHRLIYYYPQEIAWLDPWVNHGWLGLLLMAIAWAGTSVSQHFFPKWIIFIVIVVVILAVFGIQVPSPLDQTNLTTAHNPITSLFF